MDLSCEKVLDCLKQVFSGKYSFIYSTSEWKLNSPKGFKIEAKGSVIENIGTAIWYVDEHSITASFESKLSLPRKQAIREVNAANAQLDFVSNTVHIYLNDNNTIEAYIRQMLVNESDDYIKDFLGSSVVAGIDRLKWWSILCNDSNRDREEENARQEEARKKAEEEKKKREEEERRIEEAKRKAQEEKTAKFVKAVNEFKRNAEKNPSIMTNLLNKVAAQRNETLTPLGNGYSFLLNEYNEGRFILSYSLDKIPHVIVIFLSRSFDNPSGAEMMGKTISNSCQFKDLSVNVFDNSTITLAKTVIINVIADETTRIKEIINGINVLINAVVYIRDNMKKWPTKSDEETRRREEAEKEKAEKRKQMIEKCKLNIGKLKAEVADWESECIGHKGDNYYKKKRADAKADLQKEKYKLQRLEAGEDIEEFTSTSIFDVWQSYLQSYLRKK